MFTLLIAIILVMFFSLLMLADDNNLDPNRKNIKNLNQD